MMSHLHVLYAFDENYAPFCGVSVTSLFENNKHLENITVHLMGDRISEENQQKFRQTAECYKREVILYEAQAIVERIEQYGMCQYRGSYATNMRLFFSEIVQLDSDRLLYLDSDTIVVGDLEPLLSFDFNGKACALVQESLGQHYKKLIEFKPDEPYYNAGVLLINISEWKKQNCSHVIMDYLQNVKAQFANNDQDVINIVLKKTVQMLPIQYNFQSTHRAFPIVLYLRVYKSKNYYTLRQIEYAQIHPVVLHTYRFIGQFPWHDDNLHPDVKTFEQYLNISKWKEYIKRPIGRPFILQIEKMLYYLLPRSIFLKVFSFFHFQYFKRLTNKMNKR